MTALYLLLPADCAKPASIGCIRVMATSIALKCIDGITRLGNIAQNASRSLLAPVSKWFCSRRIQRLSSFGESSRTIASPRKPGLTAPSFATRVQIYRVCLSPRLSKSFGVIGAAKGFTPSLMPNASGALTPDFAFSELAGANAEHRKLERPFWN